MTRSKRLGAIALASALLFIPLVSLAAEFRTGDQPSLPQGEVLAGNLYIAGGNVNVSGSVRGDLITAGGNILVNGPVSADIAATGGSITILGNVGDDARLLGGNIVVQGRIAGDLLVGGGQVNIGGEGIGGDVAIGGGVVHIDAPIRGELRIAGGEIYINSVVSEDVFVQAETLTLGPKAVIAGNLTYSATEEAVLDEGAIVRGETSFTEVGGWGGAAKASVATFLSIWFFAKFFAIFAGALLIALVFRRYSQKLIEVATTNPLLELGRGAVFLFVTPILSVVLLMTVIGLPLGALGLIVFAGALVFVAIAAPIVIGSIAYRSLTKSMEYEVSWKTVLLGTAIYVLLGLIPFVGWVVKFGITLLTLGAILNIKWSFIKEWR